MGVLCTPQNNGRVKAAALVGNGTPGHRGSPDETHKAVPRPAVAAIAPYTAATQIVITLRAAVTGAPRPERHPVGCRSGPNRTHPMRNCRLTHRTQ